MGKASRRRPVKHGYVHVRPKRNSRNVRAVRATRAQKPTAHRRL